MAETMKPPSGGVDEKPAEKPAEKRARVLADGINSTSLTQFYERLHALADDNDSRNGAYRSDIKEVYREIQDQLGVDPDAAKEVFGDQRRELKRARRLAKMTGEDRRAFEKLRDAIGGAFGDYFEKKLEQAATAPAMH